MTITIRKHPKSKLTECSAMPRPARSGHEPDPDQDRHEVARAQQRRITAADVPDGCCRRVETTADARRLRLANARLKAFGGRIQA